MNTRRYFKVGEFYMTVNPNRDEIESWNLFLSGKKRGCLNATIYNSNRKPLITHVEYSRHCNIQQDLAPGKGTLDMFSAFFWFVRKYFPRVCEFAFQDNSKITCNDNTPVSLASYTLAFKQKTWYEEKFGAYLQDDYEVYKEKVRNFTRPEWKRQKEKAIEKILENHVNEMEILLPLLRTSSTFKEFFKKVYELHKNELKEKEQAERCHFIKQWIHMAVMKILEGDIVTPFDWILPLESQPIKPHNIEELREEPAYTRTIVETQTGGGPVFPASEFDPLE